MECGIACNALEPPTDVKKGAYHVGQDRSLTIHFDMGYDVTE